MSERAVVFDLGQVVVGWDAYLPLADRLTRDEWDRFVEESGFAELNLAGDGGVPLRDIVASAAEKDPRHGELVAHYYERFPLSLTGPVPGVSEIIGELHASGVRLLGLTNWSAETFPFAAGAAPIINELEGILVSGREGLTKPDPEIYRLLARRYDLVPERTVFIDDSPRNVDAAATLGFLALLFVDAARLRADLRALGLLG